MTTPLGSGGGGLGKRRVPFNERVEVRYKLFREFVTELSANLSLGGMFLASHLPREPGAQFEFQIRLEDDFALIEGTGEVVWRRTEEEGPERPAGMGVRFVSLTAESRKLIRRIVEEQAKSGGRPFDLAQQAPSLDRAVEEEPALAVPAPEPPVAAQRAEPPPPSLPPPTEVGSARRTDSRAPSAAESPSAEPSTPPTGPPPSAAPRPPVEPAVPALPPPAAPPTPSFVPGAPAAGDPSGRGWPASALRLAALALASAAVGGLVVWAGHRIFIEPQLEALARRVDELSHETGARAAAARPSRIVEPEPEAAAPAAAAVAAPGSLPAAARPSGGPRTADPLAAVRAWAQAWSEKRFDDYLASYSREFRPPDGLGRAAWEAQRRSRILRPGPISVTVAAMDAQDLGDGRTLVRCTQAYRSARYSDIVRKAILLRWEEDAWRIVEERVER